jgi:imidazolonepropionase
MGATTVAAQAIGSEDMIGSLLPGYAADIAIMEAPSLNHWLYHFRENACVGVIKAGDWVHGEVPAKSAATST